MSTRDIRASSAAAECDVCGRTLLRGEQSAVYLDGASRKLVCELCATRALHEGWVREGTIPTVSERSGGGERRPSLLRRLRGRRTADRRATKPTLADDLDARSWSEAAAAPDGGWGRKPRHVRAVPTSTEHKVASAIQLFNVSQHRRTVAGVARSLGPPTVAVIPSEVRASLVNLIVSWELCWYRYEVDLSDDELSVRVVGQGAELHELTPEERKPSAACDDEGMLSPLA